MNTWPALFFTPKVDLVIQIVPRWTRVTLTVGQWRIGHRLHCALAIATCAEVALVIVPLLILLGNAACQLLACVVAIPLRAVSSVRALPTLAQVVV